MANPVVKATMPTLAAGNKGFTLIEMLVVLAIIAIGTAGVSLAMRDSAQSALERDAQRLAALLESARSKSRATGVPVVWRTQASGFVFEGLAPNNLPQTWLDPQTQSLKARPVLLGPEPIIGPQSVALSSSLNTASLAQLWVVTDGLRPFTVQASPPQAFLSPP
jgi:general secretion pathway protein H